MSSSSSFKTIRRCVLLFSVVVREVAAASCETAANGDVTCKNEADETESYSCSGFQKTAKCDPVGKKEESQSCGESIEAGTSGYCLCKSGKTRKKVEVRRENCNHVKFTCEDTCRRYHEFTCVRWRTTKTCGELGSMEAVEGKDMSCDSDIDVNQNGYCECGGGRLVMPGSCHNTKFSVKTTCKRVCERGPSPYEELGTHKWASDAALKSNFRKLSLKYHPDKRPTDKDKYEGIREAQDLLTDKKTKVLYDMGAYELVKKFKENQLTDSPPSEYHASVSLAQMYKGDEITINIPKRTKICPGCTKKSKSDFCVNVCTASCPAETEISYVMRGNMRFQMQNEVPSKLKCRKEDGDFAVKIEKGTRDGESITFPAEGNQKKEHVPGDLIFKISALPDKKFTRKGNNLHTTRELSLKEALLGFRTTIKHLDGRTIEISHTGMTQHGARYVVKEEGFLDRRSGSYGDLIMTLNIRFPTKQKLSDKLVRALKEEKGLD